MTVVLILFSGGVSGRGIGPQKFVRAENEPRERGAT